MKKSYFLLIALCFLTTVKSQIISIPDVNFKEQLLKSDGVYSEIGYNSRFNPIKIDANSNGEIEVSEALNIYGLTLESYSDISDLTGIEYFTNLFFLNCNNNKLTSLNLNNLLNLNYLRCNGNLLTSLDVRSLKNLYLLNCTDNQLTSLKIEGLSQLNELECYRNKLTTLNLTGLTNLTKFQCSDNQINELYLSELTSLQSLLCAGNKLTSLNLNGLALLEYLVCDNNLLTSLNVSGFSNLRSLSCSSNLLTSFNISNSPNISYLECGYNQLNSIIKSGFYKFIRFDCSNNLLSTLDLSDDIYGDNRANYNLDNNQLTSIILKNGRATGVTFANNPKLKYICADEEEVVFITNLNTKYGYSDCNVNSYCSFTPGGAFYAIQGNQKFDGNNNGCDITDTNFSNFKFSISDGVIGGSIISNDTGNYSIPVKSGTHTITPVIENPNYFNVSPSTVSVTFPTQTSPFTQDFCITANGVRPDLEITLLPIQPARPGFDSKYKIVYKNKGNMTQSGAVNLKFNDGVLDLVVANPVISTQNLNNLSWNFTNLKPFETREITFALNVNSPSETPAVNSGFVLAYQAIITNATTDDETPIDNTFNFDQTVVNSFDPNDKTCLEGPTISPVLIGQYVHYIIRFENNGTGNAQNIVVKDMIDLSKFDISTLISTSASHSFITNISSGNKVEFIFDNIDLPFDDAANDGYIAFKIKTKPTLIVNDTFVNDASIFFDYNFPIITNKATSTFKTLGAQDFEFSNYFTLYPNPSKSILNINSKEVIEVQSISIYNTLGQLILVVPNAEKVSKIDVSGLTAGNYFIKIISDRRTTSRKFIKN